MDTLDTKTNVDDLREDLEKLVMIEEVAERRQEIIEKRLAKALDGGITPNQLRSELGLSKESLNRLVDEDARLLGQTFHIGCGRVRNTRCWRRCL